ncbi:hypothetical protein AAVH_29734, partial [Aphelenchoides avenae]
CNYNTSSGSSGPGGQNFGGGSRSTEDCGKDGKYCITGNATGYVTTGDGTTKFTASFHACDTKMVVVGDDVLQGYKGIKCKKEGVSPFSANNWDATANSESISGYIDCSTTSDPSSGFRAMASLFSTGKLLQNYCH